MSENYRLEVVEEYELLGEKRYRVRIVGTSIYLNVAAGNRDEAIEKARMMISELQLDKLIKVLSENK